MCNIIGLRNIIIINNYIFYIILYYYIFYIIIIILLIINIIAFVPLIFKLSLNVKSGKITLHEIKMYAKLYKCIFHYFSLPLNRCTDRTETIRSPSHQQEPTAPKVRENQLGIIVTDVKLKGFKKDAL